MKRKLKVNFEELKNLSSAARGYQYALNDFDAALENIMQITYQDSGSLNDAVNERIEKFKKQSLDISGFLGSVHNMIEEYCEVQQKYLTPEYLSLPVFSDRDSFWMEIEKIKMNMAQLKVIDAQNELVSFFSGDSSENDSTDENDEGISLKKQNEHSNFLKIKNISDNILPAHLTDINTEIDAIESIYKNNAVKFENSDDEFQKSLRSVYKYFRNIDFYRTTARIKLLAASGIETIKRFIKNLKMEILITFAESAVSVNNALRKNDKNPGLKENELKVYYGYSYGNNKAFSNTKCAGGELECFPKAEKIKKQKKTEHLSEYEKMHSVVFNTKKSRQYGGDQGRPQYTDKNSKEYIMMYEIASKNNAMVTPDNFDTYLEKMNYEGCGYVSLVNGIMCRYEKEPEEFEKIFGYPMYKSDKTLNYECLLTDIYSSYDNYSHGKENPMRDYNPFDDGLPFGYDKANDSTGNGTNPKFRKECLTSFMKDHGVSADMKTLDYLCPQNFKEITDSGKTVLVSLKRGKLEFEDGTTNQLIDSHSIVVTGFTDDGRIIVSSWGKRLFIDPDDHERVEHTNVITGKDTTYLTGPAMTFQTLEIK